MPFSDFHGNAEVVHTIREMLSRDRFPHGVILAGPAGSGKYTLTTMIARAMNCLERPTVSPISAASARIASVSPNLKTCRQGVQRQVNHAKD
jgi:DNA polymerase III gamma/tau subunit